MSAETISWKNVAIALLIGLQTVAIVVGGVLLARIDTWVSAVEANARAIAVLQAANYESQIKAGDDRVLELMQQRMDSLDRELSKQGALLQQLDHGSDETLSILRELLDRLER